MDRRDYMDSDRWWDQISPDRRMVTLRFGFLDEGDNLVSLDEDLEEVRPVWFPIEWIVCSGCQGRGEYVNPSIDSHGLSQEDFDQDPDFRDDYRSGVYNVTCELCKGRAVMPELPEADDILRTARDKFLDQMHAWDSESHMERMMGA